MKVYKRRQIHLFQFDIMFLKSRMSGYHVLNHIGVKFFCSFCTLFTNNGHFQISVHYFEVKWTLLTFNNVHFFAILIETWDNLNEFISQHIFKVDVQAVQMSHYTEVSLNTCISCLRYGIRNLKNKRIWPRCDLKWT